MTGMEFATALGTEVALSALSSIINKLGTYLGGDVTAEEMEHLKYFLLSEISVFIEEGKSNHFDQSKPLLEKLQETALQVDDLLDLYEYNQTKKQVSSSSTNFIKKLVPILKEKMARLLPKSSLRINLEKLLNFVEQMEKKYPYIKSAKTNGQRTQQKYKGPEATTSTLPSRYFGRHKQCERIVELLLAEPQADPDRMINEVPVIAIKGIGGSGKTHTAQSICKDERVINYFGKPIWVHVTTDFDVEKLTKKIIESASDGECPQSTNLEVLQTSLKESIKKRKRFLLILDDVWWCENPNRWDQLVGPLNEVGGKGSKIIITTREERVARYAVKENVIALDKLETEDCWSILKYYAFNNSECVIDDPELEEVGKQIISKASLFPKGYIYNKHLLVPLWIAQGYIENTNDEWTLEEKGDMYIDDLLSYSFFEEIYSSDNFVIHDLLHDLAERASGNLCHRIEHDASLSIPSKCIHLSVYITVDFQSIEIPDISKLRNLRSLIILDDASCTNIFRENTDISQILSKLRALYVEYDEHMKVLSNLHIDQLKHLRYLHLFCNEKLPKSLTKLYHLQFFNLQAGDEVIEHSHDGYAYLKPNILPQGFGNLINLRTLKFVRFGVIELDYLKCNAKAIDIGKLKSLQTVPVFYPEKDNEDGMVPLKNLPLRGSLRVCDLENVKRRGDAEKAMLKQKRNLNELILQWGSNTAGGSNDLGTCEEVLEGLEPHQNLRSLEINRYQGAKIANWMVRKSCPLRLQSLTLSDCQNIREIDFLPLSLKEVRVVRCKELTQLPPFGGTLKVLVLDDCPVLKRPQSMPNNCISLEYLEVIKCQMLMPEEQSLLVEEVAERDTAKCFSQVERFYTDEPLLVLAFVQQQGFSSIKGLRLKCTEAKPFPQLLEARFPEFSSLEELSLEGFKTLPNMEKLSALKYLLIDDCLDVELLPNLPISLDELEIERCPKLKVNYNEEDGPLHKTISHIPDVVIV